MIKPLILNLQQRDDVSDEQKALLETAISEIRDYDRGEDIVAEGSRPSHSCIVLEGFAGRYRVLPDGKRQFTQISVVGDFTDLHSLLLRTMDHSILALTPCKVAFVEHDFLRRVTETSPHLTRLLWLSTLIDASINREWIADLGGRTATGHVAHLICELFLRLRTVERTSGNSFELPLTQAELGEALGLSTVHVNRTLRELREKNVIAWESGTVTIKDWDRLQEIAAFDPAYLHLQIERR